MKEQHQGLALVTSGDIVKLNAIGFHILVHSKGLVLQDLWWSYTGRRTAHAERSANRYVYKQEIRVLA